MNRHVKIVSLCFLIVPATAIAAPGTNTGSKSISDRTESVIYKHVDENGRVTYANSPIKGGARIDLEPLTVIPSTPSGSLNPANAQAVNAPAVNMQANVATSSPRTTIPASATVTAAVTLPAKAPVQLATVFPLSSAAQTASAKTAAIVNKPAPDNTVVASLDAMKQLTQHRQAETKQRLLEGELQTEEQLLVSAKARLQEEQKLSGSIRAMRASFAPTAETVSAQKPLISPETRAEIERHFERVRNLQDQVAMHENHLQTLREQVSAQK